MMTEAMRIYFSAPLFTQAEWCWNGLLAEQLRGHALEVFLPQEQSESIMNGTRPYEATSVFADNLAAMDRAHAVVAVLDQADPDSGTCWECGYAYKNQIPVIGLRTDLREGGDDTCFPVNLMLARSCQEIIKLPLAERGNIEWVAERVVEAVRRVTLHASPH